MNAVFDRSRKTRLLAAVRKAKSEQAAVGVIRRELDGTLEPFTDEAERQSLYEGIVTVLQRLEPQKTRIRKGDLQGALASFVLVFASTVPAAIPFLIVHNAYLALRLSNLLLVAMLFGVGYAWGRFTSSSRWHWGLSLMLTGLVLVLIAVALGG